jgi:hypothetical protein
MRAIRIFLFMFVLLTGTYSMSEEIEPALFFKRINNAVQDQNFNEMLSLLGELDSAEVWSFGAGVGPVTAESLQYSIVQILSDQFLNAENLGKKYVNDKAIVAIGEKEKKWLDMLYISHSDLQEILRLLNDPNPAIRWIGLNKVAVNSELDAQSIKMLRHIMSNDSYMQITKSPINSSEDKPVPPGLNVNDFSYPLRCLACQTLNAKGYSCALDNMELARNGVVAMAQTWENQANHRTDLEDAIALLNPNGFGFKAVRELGARAKSFSAFGVFLQKISDK